MSTVTKIRDAWLIQTHNGKAERVLWRTDDNELIVTSSVLNLWDQETVAFYCDENGEPTTLEALGWAAWNQHERALLRAGYTIKGNDGA